MVGNVDQYFDITALVVVFVIAVLYLLGVDGDEICIPKFGHGIVWVGCFGSITDIIAFFGSDGFSYGNIQVISAALKVCLLTVL